MPDYNLVLTPGDIDDGKINAVNEIPTGSHLKIEYDRKRLCFKIDRVEPSIYAKPVNYGFIPATTDEDGDELDVLIVTSEPIPTGIWLECFYIGVLKFEDGGEIDHKIVAVPADDRDSGDSIKSLDDLSERWRQQISEHFTHYKDLKKPSTTKVLGWGDQSEAKAIIQDSIARFNKAKP